MSNSKMQIFVISHSENDIKKIKSDEIYVPLFVGRHGKDNLGFCSDDSGDNISIKNSTYCELTGLYWMWKNCDADVVGLVHYRRWFAKNEFDARLEKEDIEEIFKNYDIIIPKKSITSDSVYDEYAKSHFAKDLDLCGEIIKEKYPNYLDSYNKFINNDQMYYCNLFIAPKEIISSYCVWLFSILDEIEKRVDISEYDDYQKRVFGFLGERLFNIWLMNNNLKVKESYVKVSGLRLKLNTWSFTRKLIMNVYFPILNFFKKEK